MLKTLLIKDYALIENIQVEFGKGLNIITGETGAGKSIIIDAMNLLLGERASTEVVRKGAEKSIVEGIFEVGGNKRVGRLLSSNEIDVNDDLIIRREISLKGTNRCFLNDTPVTLNLIKETGDLLVDLHGQHEHQSLLHSETHIEMLDEFSSNINLLDDFQKSSGRLSNYLKELKELTGKENIIKERKDLFEFQIKEIDSVNPMEDEEGQLESELKIMENSERLVTLTNEVYNSIYEDEGAIRDRLAEVKNKLVELSDIDNQFEEKVNECESAVSLLEDISVFIRGYKDKIDMDPVRLEEIRERLGALNLLKKKYGGSLKAVIEHRKKIGEEFDLAENFAGKISALIKEIDNVRKDCGAAAIKISTQRKNISKKIKKEVEEILKFLGIQDSVFDVRIINEKTDATAENFILVEGQKYKYDEYGYDFVEFFISTNPGEDPKPLAKIASGGEISRVMLALKSILAKSDQLPILIFDEIDTGVSGRIAQKVGQVLKSLSLLHQVIAITHLPQIAGLSDIHFTVEKKKISDRVVSSITKIVDDDKIKEVAKLISGENITEASLNSAKELIGFKISSN